MTSVDPSAPELPSDEEVDASIKVVTDNADRIFAWNYERDRDQLVLGVLAPPTDLGATAYRSTFRRLMERRSDARIRYDVLRPPTLGRLTSVLLEAESLGEPYHVVHLDGMGVYADLTEEESLTPELRRAARARAEDVRPGQRGYLVLDHAQDSSRIRLVDAAALADAMGEARVPVIVLNNDVALVGEDAVARRKAFKPRAAFQAVAQDLTEYGLSAAVQSPYILEPAASADWLESFYAGLAAGHPAGESARLARQRGVGSSMRSIAYDPVERPDWSAPIVHESIPAPVLTRDGARAPEEDLEDSAESPTTAVPRDDVVVQLDRQFQGAACVLLHGPAGSGKTHTAEEFAAWLKRTQGLEGPVLRSSVAHRRSLGSLLDHLASVFQGALKKTGLEWERMNLEERFDTALYIMNQIPILWIWDGFEGVGSPAGSPQGWDEEQRELVREFLESCTETQARILLLSRSDEEWMAKGVRRVEMRPMPGREALSMARSLIEESKGSTTDMSRCVPLVDFAKGNPLALRLMICQAIAERALTATQMGALAEKVSTLNEDPTEAALAYALDTGFNDQDHDVLGLLQLFRRGVDLDRIAAMVAPHRSWALSDLAKSIYSSNGQRRILRSRERVNWASWSRRTTGSTASSPR